MHVGIDLYSKEPDRTWLLCEDTNNLISKVELHQSGLMVNHPFIGGAVEQKNMSKL